MTLSRRGFLKLSATAALTTAFGGLGLAAKPAKAKAAVDRIAMLKPEWSRQTTSVCCYCAVGCGLLVNTALSGSKRALNVEGDPDHPINEGALCAKGASIYQLTEGTPGQVNPRLQKVMYRKAYGTKWEAKSWDWALEQIAKRVKRDRDASFVTKNAQGVTVNRCEGIASVGSAAIDNEECWAYQAFMRSLGLTYIEHQARICHSSTVAALAESFGRGAMTNHWIDIKNSDCILIMGSNAAETHPISFKWVTRAQDAGATVIHVDPRFTRTSSKANLYAPLRSGTDIAFLGGMIHYILENDLAFKEYVVNNTNSSFIVGKDFGFKDGMFSGFDEKTHKYDKKKWAFEYDAAGIPKRDNTLADPRCVFQLMKQHYTRYTLKNVSATTGTPQDKLLAVYKAYSATGKPDKAGTSMYAMGWTQHTVGVQNIRSMAMIQLLLGNMGVAGGGVNALRGESNVQGSTDHALLYHIIPGYMPTPTTGQPNLEAYSKLIKPESKDPKSMNWKKNYPKYIASLLKSFYKNADPAQSYDWLPKLEVGQNNSWLVLFDKMFQNQFKGFFAWGMNPAVSGANSNKTRQALGNLDWMVTVNIYDSETSSFWRGPGLDPKKVKTEVFMLPCCVSTEKEGSITNSGRWMQWRYQGPKPLGESRPDGEIMFELAQKLRELYKKEGGVFPEPVLGLNWEDMGGSHGFDAHKTARLINGYYLKDVEEKQPDGSVKVHKEGTQVASFAKLKADGSTCSGNWIYCGSYVDEDPAKGNRAMRRSKEQTPAQANIGLYPNWTWAWPVNRRIIYNRAGVDLTGKAYAPQKAVLAWNAAGKKWDIDVVDGGGAPGSVHPFIMQVNGMGRLFGPGLNDGPFPEHYEPRDCPVSENVFSKTLNSPTSLSFKGEKHSVCDPRYPIVCTSYRVTEHWQTGLMTRYQPWLLEAQPQMFCEISEELAKLRGIKNGEKVILENERGKLWAVAMVTKRFKPMKIQGNTTHQVGIPWHFGWLQPKDGGDAANLLTPSVGDPNTGIPETKAFMVNVRKA
ncbi:MAG: formate dehydrogenase-N subunit alpha [Proteobacteria bacterium]|nr:formate dehydrogenase-N subunit alpha [Pseudomonadota bacterium]MBU1596750.1 formate dehydrogenase-N subunit alpha [Pseudomonadota bacterium]